VTASLVLRDATPADAGLIAGFVRDLAVYENLLHEAVASDTDFAEAIAQGHIASLIAELDGAPVGFALWFHTFSTFQGKRGLYLEDIYVQPAHRGHGIGKAIFRDLARRALAAGCTRVEWSVLDWNEPSIKFYRAIGAVPMDEWTVQRLDAAEIAKLAQQEA
jgi:GNAT superfamily N-acetyltransferase